MISLDSLRSAVLSNQPWSELDRLVQVELSSGRMTNQIYDELVGMTEELRATPGFSEQSEEAFGDTLDRLSGFCRAESAYKNPPTLPTEEEIAKLPRWARVAFAARCARRLIPLIGIGGSESDSRSVDDSRRSVECAEQIAKSAGKEKFLTDQLFKQWTTELERGFTKHEVPPGGVGSSGSEQLSPVGNAALEVIVAVLLYSTGEAENKTGFFRFGEADLKRLIALDVPVTVIRADFDRLLAYSQSQQSEDTAAISPDIFGPLWPEGPPINWPVDTDTPKHTDIALEVVNSDGLDERVVEDEVVSLFNAINCYHIARGGQPLSLEDFRPQVSALVPAGM